MSIDITKLFSDNKIEFRTSGLELSSGWVAFACPYCSDAKSHMGYSQRLDLMTCWRCGPKNKRDVIRRVLKVPFDMVDKYLRKYFIPGSKESTFQKKAKEVFLPPNHGRLKKGHKQYLKGRGFDPKQLEKDWCLSGSRGHSLVGKGKEMVSFKDRVIIPIYFRGELVSYHSRDITDKQIVKARPCPKEKESASHQKLLYGFDRVFGNTVIVSEGPADVWRWNGNAVGTFGIKYTKHQVDLLRAFKNIFIAFDGGKEEVNAQKAAERLADEIGVFCNVWVVDVGCDPADLTPKKAKRIKDKLFKEVSR